MNKKRAICFGDSNTWGYRGDIGGRYDDDARWTQIAQRELGEGYMIVEEGLSGRTTVFHDPLNEGLCGIDYLLPCLLSHQPIDLLTIMLGTNDTKERFSASPQNIADGLDRLIQKAKTAAVWRGESKFLIIAPIIIDERCYISPVAGEMGSRCVEKSRELPRLMKQYAQQNGHAFLDCNDYSGVNDVDFMHLTLEGHASLGKAVGAKIKELLG